MIELAGKSVVVTGAGRGLGRAYADDAALRGAAVVVNDIDGAAAESVVADIRARGGTAVADGRSITDAGEAAHLVETCVKEFGRIDGLVNNAGLFHVASPWEEKAERVAKLFEVNVLGPMWCALAAIPHFKNQQSGSIVNVVSGAMVGIAGMSTYGASKGAVASMTYGWARDLADFGVRVNAISPIADTRMTASVGQHAGVDPSEIAPLVSYLLSDRSDFSGQILRLAFGRLSFIRPPMEAPVEDLRPSWDAAAAEIAISALLATPTV